MRILATVLLSALAAAPVCAQSAPTVMEVPGVSASTYGTCVTDDGLYNCPAPYDQGVTFYGFDGSVQTITEDPASVPGFAKYVSATDDHVAVLSDAHLSLYAAGTLQLLGRAALPTGLTRVEMKGDIIVCGERFVFRTDPLFGLLFVRELTGTYDRASVAGDYVVARCASIHNRVGFYGMNPDGSDDYGSCISIPNGAGGAPVGIGSDGTGIRFAIRSGLGRVRVYEYTFGAGMSYVDTDYPASPLFYSEGVIQLSTSHLIREDGSTIIQLSSLLTIGSGYGVINQGGGVLSVVSLDPQTLVPGDPYCFADGSMADCPCGATDPAAGCPNSTGSGATLSAYGSATRSVNESLRFEITGLPAGRPGLLFASTGAPVDVPVSTSNGLICISGGGTVRSQVVFSDTQGFASLTDWEGSPFQDYERRSYQFWYRDVNNTCAPGGFNFTNAHEIDWLP